MSEAGPQAYRRMHQTAVVVPHSIKVYQTAEPSATWCTSASAVHACKLSLACMASDVVHAWAVQASGLAKSFHQKCRRRTSGGAYTPQSASAVRAAAPPRPPKQKQAKRPRRGAGAAAPTYTSSRQAWRQACLPCGRLCQRGRQHRCMQASMGRLLCSAATPHNQCMHA